jgi:type 1 glutamine amidotransferase
MEQHNGFPFAFIDEMHVEPVHMPVVRRKRVGITECFASDSSVFHIHPA